MNRVNFRNECRDDSTINIVSSTIIIIIIIIITRTLSIAGDAGIVLAASVSVCLSVRSKTEKLSTKLFELGRNMCYG